MPVAVFPSLPISGFSRFCRPAVLLFQFCCVTSLHAFYYLLPNPFSLFLLLSFYFDNVLGCNSALFWGEYLCLYLSLSYMVPQSGVVFFPLLRERYSLSPPIPTQEKNLSPPRLCL